MLKSNMTIIWTACTIVLLTGCPDLESGNRPENGCPDGEKCSEVVTHLFFSGASLGDEILTVAPKPSAIAKGGIQNINVWLDSEAKLPFGMLPNFPDGLMGPFCEDPVTGAALAYCPLEGGLDVLSIQPSTPPVVKVRGERVGLDQLRITASFGENANELHDRIILEVVQPSEIRVVAPPDFDFATVHGDRVKDAQIAFAVNSQPPAVVVGMFGRNNANQRVRVADESVSFINLPMVLTRNPAKWDTLRLSGPFPQTQDHLIGVMSGSGESLGQVRFRVVGTVNSLSLADGLANHVPASGNLIAGQTKQVCFSSFARFGNQDHLIYGAKLKVERISNVEVTPATSAGQQFMDSCATVQAPSAGIAEIRVTSDANPNSVGGEFMQGFYFNVCPSSGCSSAQAPRGPAPSSPGPGTQNAGPAPGERADAR